MIEFCTPPKRQSLFRKALLIFFVVVFSNTAGSVLSQVTSTKEQEEALTRKELQRIIAENGPEAENAKKALEALNQPETSVAGRQARNRRERGARRIVNGLPLSVHPAVGALLRGNDPHTAQAWCTGTLVGCDKFLTAAHCIAEAPNADGYLVFFQDLGFFKAKQVEWPKGDYKFPYFDLAMLTLDRSVEGIAPAGINLTTKPLNKSLATIVGFGRTGGYNQDYGIKREGTVLTQACPAERSKQKLLCWQYSADAKAFAAGANTCNGDSGGAVFMPDDEGGKVVQKLFGVVSGGKDKNCVKDDLSYNVDTHAFKDWIIKVGEARLSSRMCGTTTRVTNRIAQVLELGPDQQQHMVSFVVSPNSEMLRVTLNGQDSWGKNNFDLHLFQGDGPIPNSFSCSADGTGQFGVCEIGGPQPGIWSALIKRKQGAGLAQVTINISPAKQ